MGLGGYGEPVDVDQVRDVARTVDGQVALNLHYFRHHTKGVEMTWEGGEPSLGAAYSDYMLVVS